MPMEKLDEIEKILGRGGWLGRAGGVPLDMPMLILGLNRRFSTLDRGIRLQVCNLAFLKISCFLFENCF